MLPKNLRYNSKVESAMAKSSRVNIQPQNGSGNYFPGDTVIFNIPTRNNLCMIPQESYLKFDLVVTSSAAANAFRFDACGAHGIWKRIRVFHGSSLLSDCDEYGLLAKMLFDLAVSGDSTYGKQNILAGCRSDLVTNFTAAVAGGENIPALQINSGERLFKSTGTTDAIAATETTEKITYCLNLISLVGSLTSQYIPLFAMTSAPLRVEIQLVSNVLGGMGALAGGTTNNFTVSNCEYVMNAIELSDSAMSTIYASLGNEPLQFVFPDYRNYQFTQALPNTPTQVTFAIPAKFSSLKSLFITIRDNAVPTVARFPYSSVKSGVSEYTFRIGASVMPSKAPASDAEFFAEVCKAVASLSDLNHQPSIDKRSYTLATTPAYTESTVAGLTSASQSGSFYIGLDTENYAGASKDQIFSGLNTNQDDIFCQLTMTSPTARTTRFDAFANFDCVIVCENNVAYSKF